MNKVLSALILVLLYASCGDTGGTSQATDDAGATPARATPAGVKAAKEGTVNLPKEGTYVYDYESERRNAATPNATPQRSSSDAELSSKVTVNRDVVTIADQTTEGPAVATVKRRHADDGVYELSFETRAPQGTPGCTFENPIKILPIPLKEEALDSQSFEGDGTSCDGERKVTIEGPEDVKDADGAAWSTWRIVMVNTVRTTSGLSSRSTLTLWFSPDLGKEVKAESVAETLDADGQVAARGESTQLLKSYPT